MKISDSYPAPKPRRTKDEPTREEQKTFDAYCAEYRRVNGFAATMIEYNPETKFATFAISRGCTVQIKAKRCTELTRMLRTKEGVL